MTEAKLTREDAEGEFASMVAARGPALMRTAYLLIGDAQAAQDLLQSALTKTFASIGHLREPAAAEKYVRVTMSREAVRMRTKAYQRQERPTAELPERAARACGSESADDELWQLLLLLPARQRAVLVLRYYEELSEMEIADVLGCRPGTVKSQASKALRNLRRRIQTTRSLEG